MKKLLSILAGGGALSQLILQLSAWLGVTIDPSVAIWLAAFLSAGSVWLYHNGFDGLWQLVRHGHKG